MPRELSDQERAELADKAAAAIADLGNTVFPVPHTGGGEHGNAPGPPLYFDVAGFLDGGLPDPPKPVLLTRDDGHAIFYSGQVNYLFGDPESGKTLIAQAACAEALLDGRRVLFVDIDHNGPQATLSRLLDMGVTEEALRDPIRFRYVEPEDRGHLAAIVADACLWRPAGAVVDSVGELIPLLGLSSNSPDDFTIAHTRVLKPLAVAGAAVIALDHLPKNTEQRASGPTGTAAKRRAVGGVSIRVTVNDPFTPGSGGSAYLNVNKDRHGGLRRYCPVGDGKREPAAGMFSLDSGDGWMKWAIRAPAASDPDPTSAASPGDLAALDALDPPPESVRDVKDRMRWRSDRAAAALREWRSRSQNVPREQGTDESDGVPPFPPLGVGNGERVKDYCTACGMTLPKHTRSCKEGKR